jgi:hypothetical protein
MKKNPASAMLLVLLIGTSMFVFNIQPAETQPPKASQEPPPTEWTQTYGGTSGDWCFSVIQTVDGGYALAGRTDSFGAAGSFWLVKTDSSGNMLWNQTYGGASSDAALCVVQTGDGGYALVGSTDSFGAGWTDFWLVKVAPDTIPGDFDGDGDVDRYDFGILAGAYGSKIGDPNWNAVCDLDRDGDVDRYDFGTFAGNYGKGV